MAGVSGFAKIGIPLQETLGGDSTSRGSGVEEHRFWAHEFGQEEDPN